MTSQLPFITPMVLSEAVDALPVRLRKRLDAMAAKAAGWPVTADGSTVTVTVDSAVAVTLTVTAGVVASSDDVRCCCLLAPQCLHRAAVLARAPIADTAPEIASDEPDEKAGLRAESADEDRVVVTLAQRSAASNLRRAAIAVLEAGVTGTGAVGRAEILRAAHEARAVGCHRAAATARRAAARLLAARQDSPSYRLSDLTDDLCQLLLVTRALMMTEVSDPSRRGAPGDLSSWLGTARRRYDPVGGLRLYGLCTVPIVAESGYSGVITYLVDRKGVIWTVADIAPGGPERAATAGNATVSLGDAAMTHRALSHAGLNVTGALASAGRQLGSGKEVRAVGATGVAWTEDPLNHLWEQPLPDQVSRTFAALADPGAAREAGADLLFLTVRIVGATPGAVLARLPGGTVISLVGPVHDVLAHRENLRTIGARPGLEYRVIGTPDPLRSRTVHAHALAPVGFEWGSSGGGQINLGFDRLHSSQLPAGTGQVEVIDPGVVSGGQATDSLVRRQVERIVSGGRTVAALGQSQGGRLRAARWEAAARLSDALTQTASTSHRDVFGRLVGDTGEEFADAWLALAVYAAAASLALAEASWGD